MRAALAVAAAVALAAAGPAAARTRTLEEARAGAWHYRAALGPAPDARRYCILENAAADGTGHLRIVLASRPYDAHVSLRNARWRVAPGTRGTVRIEVDALYASTQRVREAGRHEVSVELADNPEGAARLLHAIARGQRITLTIPGGPVATAGLAGTSALVRRLLDCFERHIRAGPP
jgi:hypothetical protein